MPFVNAGVKVIAGFGDGLPRGTESMLSAIGYKKHETSPDCGAGRSAQAL